MKIPIHSKLRRSAKKYLYKLIANKNSDTKSVIEDTQSIKKIVIIRPNYRIGNIILLTPLINELYKILPDAKIDIVVGLGVAGNILKPMPNVDKIVAIPRKLLKNPIKLYKFIKETQKKDYDLAINISAGSMSSQIVTSLINAKYKASFKNDKNLIQLTHSIEDKKLYTHSGSRPLELLALFTKDIPKDNVELDIKLTQDELKDAKDELDKLTKEFPNSKKIALFRNARFDKKISDSWWIEWHKELLKLDKNIVVIDVLSPDITQKLNDDVLEYFNKDLRKLGAFFSVCDLYISADTGPLHLATASKAKVIALFNKTDAKTYGTLNKKDLTIDINNKTPKDIAEITIKQLFKS